MCFVYPLASSFSLSASCSFAKIWRSHPVHPRIEVSSPSWSECVFILLWTRALAGGARQVNLSLPQRNTIASIRKRTGMGAAAAATGRNCESWFSPANWFPRPAIYVRARWILAAFYLGHAFSALLSLPLCAVCAFSNWLNKVRLEKHFLQRLH